MTTKTLDELRRERDAARARGEAARRALGTLKLSKVLEAAGALEGVSRDVAKLLLGEAKDVRFNDEGEVDLATWNGTRYAGPDALAIAYLAANPYFTAEPDRRATTQPAEPPPTEERTLMSTKKPDPKNYDEMSAEELATVGLTQAMERQEKQRKAGTMSQKRRDALSREGVPEGAGVAD